MDGDLCGACFLDAAYEGLELCNVGLGESLEKALAADFADALGVEDFEVVALWCESDAKRCLGSDEFRFDLVAVRGGSSR